MFRRLTAWWKWRSTWKAVAKDLRAHAKELHAQLLTCQEGLDSAVRQYREVAIEYRAAVAEKGRLMDELEAERRIVASLRLAIIEDELEKGELLLELERWKHGPPVPPVMIPRVAAAPVESWAGLAEG